MAEHHSPRQLNAYVCLFITFSAAALTLVLRLVARRLMKVQLWYDDYLAITAFFCAAVWAALMLWWLQVGLGLFLDEINMPAEWVLERNRLILWNAELFYAFSLAFAKLAILAFYWRMFKTSKIKTPIKVLAGCAIIWLIMRTFMVIFHCVPVQKFWRTEVSGVCNINDSRFFFGTVLTHLIIDVAILALPVIEVQKLHLPVTQRLGIMGMFLFGIFVCIASIVVLVYSYQYDTASPEMPWNVWPIIVWATVEVNLAVVSACLPMLRPIYLLMLRKPLTKNSSTGSNYHHGPEPTSHKLTTFTQQKEVNKFDKFESDSTHQLAESGPRGSMSSDSSYGGDGPTTVIIGSAEDRMGADGLARPGRTEFETGLSDVGGILVTTEMNVRIDKAE